MYIFIYEHYKLYKLIIFLDFLYLYLFKKVVNFIYIFFLNINSFLKVDYTICILPLKIVLQKSVFS